MHQFGKVVLFLFFVNYLVGKEEKISEIGTNVTYGNMSLVNIPMSDYQNYQSDYNQFQYRPKKFYKGILSCKKNRQKYL